MRRFVLRFCAAGDADADARAGIFQQLIDIAPDGSLLDALDPWLRHDNPCKPTPAQTVQTSSASTAT